VDYIHKQTQHILRMNDTQFSKLMCEYTPPTKRNMGQPNNGWRNQHPWSSEKPGKAYTLSIMMTFCRWYSGQSSKQDMQLPGQSTQFISPGQNVQPFGGKCYKCTKSMPVQTLTCETLQWTGNTGFHFVSRVWKCNTLRQYWTSNMTRLVHQTN
jgi:hypothetical protein